MEANTKDPLICSYCGGELILWKIWHPLYGVIYDKKERLKSVYYVRDHRGKALDVRWL
jgi:hypothetical protein